MKNMLFAAALIAALIPMASAQDSKSQPASLGEKISVRGTATVMSHDWRPVQAPTAPSYCKPCAFYSGDMDPNNANNNGLANETDQLVADSHIWSPFRVSKAAGIKVKGLFVNSLDTVGAIDNPTPWTIAKGVKLGVAGHVVKTGKGTSTDTPTGRSAFGLTEYTHLVKAAATLKKGVYFENVTPVCLTGSSCGSARYFESDEEDDPAPMNHVGPKNILDDSFWNSTTFGTNYVATWGSTGGCGGIGCDMFSAGVLGK